jgi:hypothetical protein
VPNDVPWIFPKLHGSTMRKTPREPCWVFAQSPNGDHWVLVQVHKHVGASQVTKKSRGKQLGKAKLSSDTEKKSPWENQKSRRSMIYKWSMFTHFPELCQKMSQILEFNGWLTPLEWSINCTFMWKNLSLQGQPQFSGPMFTVETHAWTYWNGDEKGQYATFNTLNTPSSTPTCECILHRLWCVIPPCSTRTSCSWLHIPWDPTISNDIRQNRW